MSLTAISPKSQAIARLNDGLRQTLQGGKVMLTAAVDALAPDVKAKVLEAVRAFSEFTPDNDPHGEHDMGFFEIAGDRYLFKIDCYDKELEFGSEEPSNPDVTTRVLTIMHASDY